MRKLVGEWSGLTFVLLEKVRDAFRSICDVLIKRQFLHRFVVVDEHERLSSDVNRKHLPVAKCFHFLDKLTKVIAAEFFETATDPA